MSACTSTYLIRGEGGTSCATVLQQVQANPKQRIVYSAWLSGYLTKYNFDHEAELGGPFDADTLLNSALQYCRQKPLSDFSNVAERLLKELKKQN